MSEANERLRKQMEFIIEADRLKHVLRRSYTCDQSRRENTAEHSWHVCLMAIILSEHSDVKGLDLLKIVKMLIIHDIVEIDAGDTYIHDTEGKEDQEAREKEAANRLFGLLPDDQATEFREIWDEFESWASPEATFAKSLDRLHPVALNTEAKGKTWAEHGTSEAQVREINGYISKGSQTLWKHADELIAKCVDNGWLEARNG